MPRSTSTSSTPAAACISTRADSRRARSPSDSVSGRRCCRWRSADYVADARTRSRRTYRPVSGDDRVRRRARSAPALAHFPGEPAWTAALAVDACARIRPAGASVLTLASDLRGIAIDLPSPLDEDRRRRRAVRACARSSVHRCRRSRRSSAISRARADACPRHGNRSPHASRSARRPAAICRRRGVAIGGAVDIRCRRLARSGAAELGRQRQSSAGSLCTTSTCASTDFQIDAKSFGATRLLVGDESGATEVRIDGGAISGVLRIPGQDIARQGVTARFDRFHWPEAAPDAKDDDETRFPTIAPASLPPLHISINDFMLGKASFGEAEFESHPTAEGMHVDKLESQSPNVTMTATGDWTGTAQTTLASDHPARRAESRPHDGCARISRHDRRWPDQRPTSTRSGRVRRRRSRWRNWRPARSR